MTIILYDRRFTVSLCLLRKQPRAHSNISVFVLFLSTAYEREKENCKMWIEIESLSYSTQIHLNVWSFIWCLSKFVYENRFVYVFLFGFTFLLSFFSRLRQMLCWWWIQGWREERGLPVSALALKCSLLWLGAKQHRSPWRELLFCNIWLRTHYVLCHFEYHETNPKLTFQEKKRCHTLMVL